MYYLLVLMVFNRFEECLRICYKHQLRLKIFVDKKDINGLKELSNMLQTLVFVHMTTFFYILDASGLNYEL